MIQRGTEFDAFIMFFSQFLPLTRGWGGVSATPETSAPGKMLRHKLLLAESTGLQDPFGSDDLSDPVALNKFGSLLLAGFGHVCLGLYGML